MLGVWKGGGSYSWVESLFVRTPMLGRFWKPYSALGEDGFAPRPNYWAALLWRRIMGTVVLNAGVEDAPGLHVYAHNLPPASITFLAFQDAGNPS